MEVVVQDETTTTSTTQTKSGRKLRGFSSNNNDNQHDEFRGREGREVWDALDKNRINANDI